jgi:hypothetical protein
MGGGPVSLQMVSQNGVLNLFITTDFIFFQDRKIEIMLLARNYNVLVSYSGLN